MSYQIDLKTISTVISAPPFSKPWSIIQLHDEISPPQLLDTIFGIAAYLDESNKTSVFNQDRPLDDKVPRLIDFLGMLKYQEANTNTYLLLTSESLTNDVMQMARQSLLAVLTFLLKDLATHKKRAYLALYLSIPEIPVDFSQDESTFD